MSKRQVNKTCPRVAVLGTRGFPHVQGGVEKHCRELYPRLVKAGCRVTVLARAGYTPAKPYEYRGVALVPLWAPRKKHLEAILHTARGLFWAARRGKEFDILHIHGIGPSLLAPLVRLTGLRLAVTNHGPDYRREKWGPLARFILRLGERLGCGRAHGVIAVSRHIRHRLAVKYGTRATYIPNGVEIPSRASSFGALEALDLAPGRYFLAVGRLVPEKGFHDLLKAYAKLNTDWKLAIVGAADHEDDYSRDLARKAAATRGAVMAGFRKGADLRELFSHAGLFVLPSYHEGLPIAALEAMSYQLPLLLSDIPANREAADPGELFPVGNVTALAEKLAAHARNPSLPRAAGLLEKKKHALAAEYNWDAIAGKTLETYRNILILT